MTATAVDVAENTTTGSTSFSLRVTFDSLGVLSRRFVSHQGLASGMVSLLQAAERADRMGLQMAKSRQLEAYLKLVDAAQRVDALSAPNAAVLIRLVSAL